jgi:hypothetical protein
MRAASPAAALALLAALLSGCTLTEVVTEQGADVVVVEAILRSDRLDQTLLLHRSLGGTSIRGEPGATVVVRDRSGRSVAFTETSRHDRCVSYLQDLGDYALEASCYIASEPLDAVPGESYWLDVTTVRGEHLRSRTVVPGAFGFRGLPHDTIHGFTHSCELPPFTPLTLTWSRSAGAWSYIATMDVFGLSRALAGSGIRDVPDPLELTGLAISEQDTSIVLPAHFGVFERTEYDAELLRLLQRGFPADVDVLVSVAAVDRNYVNAIRGGRFNPSGNVRISSIVGDGVGVFGSLVPIEMRAAVADPRNRHSHGDEWPSCIQDDNPAGRFGLAR